MNICIKLLLFISIIHCARKTVFNMCLTDVLLSLRVKLDQKENKTPLDRWVPWYTSLFSSIIIRLLTINITFPVTSSLVSMQGIPGLRGEKGKSGSTGLKVKVKHKHRGSSPPHLSWMRQMSSDFPCSIYSTWQTCSTQTKNYDCIVWESGAVLNPLSSVFSSPAQGLPGDTGVLGPVGPPGLKVGWNYLKTWNHFKK